MSFLSLVVAVFLLVIYYAADGLDEKRILLDDQQNVQQELTRFQSELQEMQVKFNTQNTELADLKNKYTTQSAALTKIQAEFTAQSQELVYLQSIVATMQNTLTQPSMQGNKGAVFTRWGRQDCPANVTTVVYSGSAGGSYFNATGAAAEYICMPNEPIWGPHRDLVYSGNVAYVYGAEYEEPKVLFGMSNYAEDVPCAVCLGPQYTAYLMIPGRTQCYPGWTEMYHGDLASGHFHHLGATQYVCVDGDTQTVPGGDTHDDIGRLFYGVKAKCGSLPCPPYEDDKFLSCVVCMK